MLGGDAQQILVGHVLVHARGVAGDDADGRVLDAHLPAEGRLGHQGDADDLGVQGPHHPRLGGGLVPGPVHAGVDDPAFVGDLLPFDDLLQHVGHAGIEHVVHARVPHQPVLHAEGAFPQLCEVQEVGHEAKAAQPEGVVAGAHDGDADDMGHAAQVQGEDVGPKVGLIGVLLEAHAVPGQKVHLLAVGQGGVDDPGVAVGRGDDFGVVGIGDGVLGVAADDGKLHFLTSSFCSKVFNTARSRASRSR